MLYLAIIVLLFGLLQSYLELKKDKKNTFKWSIEKVLSVLYILGFISGIILLVLQNKDSNNANRLIGNIFGSVNKIDSVTTSQYENLSKSIQETERLLTMTDSMNNQLKTVLEIKDNLILQTNALNKQLASQLDLERQLLKGDRPHISLLTSNLKWVVKDSTTKSVVACFSNLGKRNAIITKIAGNIVFFNREKIPFFDFQFAPYSFNTTLSPISVQWQMSCLISELQNVDQNIHYIDFVALGFLVEYNDPFDNSKYFERFYFGWYPDLERFGKLKDWQIPLFKEWIKNNSKVL